MPALRAGARLDPSAFAAVRRRTMLEGCKWDPQVGDAATLADFPLLMPESTWHGLAQAAEAMTGELMAIEQAALATRASLQELGLPDRLVDALYSDEPPTPAAVRVMRFDFHPTTAGWRVSEVNSDVPGGFTEASFFTRLMAEASREGMPAGDPLRAWADGFARGVIPGGQVALLSAPGYLEDRQVTVFLARELHRRGWQTHLAHPAQLHWRDGVAHLETNWHRGPMDAIVRFFQAEWLAAQPDARNWRRMFHGGLTPVTNPGIAAVGESKRLPLLWRRFGISTYTWLCHLPETRHPNEVPWEQDDSWVLKPAMCNTGEMVLIRPATSGADWARAVRAVKLQPDRWIAQRRFPPEPVNTPDGPRQACIGVYVVDGRCAGAYARLSERAVIDFAATDVALLLTQE